MDHHALYMTHADAAYGAHYAACVRRFQDGFMAGKVRADLDSAFEMAVEACERLIPAIKARSPLPQVAA